MRSNHRIDNGLVFSLSTFSNGFSLLCIRAPLGSFLRICPHNATSPYFAPLINSVTEKVVELSFCSEAERGCSGE